MALASLASATARAGSPPIPPHLSQASAAYYAAHRAELEQLVAHLPHQRHDGVAASATAASPWQAVTTPAPAGGMSNPMLLTDGTVLIHASCTPNWYRLTPDKTGSYVNGTWSTIATLPTGYAPLYFASQILDDGRMVINGGEYNAPSGSGTCGNGVWTNLGAIYDPTRNAWTALAPPTGWKTIGDAQSIILPSTKYMLANCCTKQEAILNTSVTPPKWTATGTGKADENDEEGWALMHGGTVLTADAYVYSGCGRNTERYTPSNGAWSSAGPAAVQLSDCSGKSAGTGPSYEIGPVVVRMSGTAVAFSGVATGAVAGTSIYSPSTRKWTAGPNIPAVGGLNYDLADAPAVALPNGDILFAASPGLYKSPMHFFEFTAANTIVQTADTPYAPYDGSWYVHFLLLPTGQVLQTDFSTDVEIYTPTGAPLTAWRPVITSVPTGLTRGHSYTIGGQQMNGLTHGVYGDDAQAATNFPLVRIANNATGHVVFAKTSGFSTRSDAPGAASTATFVLPAPVIMEAGASSLVVVANGIASAPTAVTVY